MGIINQKQHKHDKKTIHFTLASSKDLLLIFTRNPELGKCKTRLAETVGDETALDIYRFLLQHTASITRNLNAAKQVWYSEEIWDNDIWDEAYYDKKLQKGQDLGVRMANAFQEGFASGYERIVIIGSDMFDLSRKDLENAFAQLKENDFVIGPAEDGGYYLMGMKSFRPELFTNKKWSSETVLEDTLRHLEDENLAILDEKNDIDVYKDIRDQEAFRHFF
ncbi:TIGR04282 family arsenosugar biosynthesis glycosyltransferase [Pricia sp. S334]|uniref:TIGR04282 family arsenosugar biosynthesis glycosyltransferase n=1 Tax=Pricia mediterranea TaxID=3076079 RepID=A0ABU3L854_9FLAO|nr:TIGR04282 family arsenosugar biosynthesis glycosyltransferase [Pricia sp. S334]MDT7829242.1 TIGR04282 family arsenosugar biosynthesis glycosyltransferase [Pricia sp. S334]